MRYNTIVDKDEQGLLMILRAAEKFDEDRFLEGIHQRCYTAEDILQAIDQVRAYQARQKTCPIISRIHLIAAVFTIFNSK